MRREEPPQIFFVLELIFVERVSFSTVRRFYNGVAAKNAVAAESTNYLLYDFADFNLGEMLNGSVPNDIVEWTRRKPISDIALNIGNIRSRVVAFRVWDCVSIEINRDD